ncbi:MAG: glycoside hydrolase family 10 protein [Marinilabiliaceae bacterium]
MRRVLSLIIALLATPFAICQSLVDTQLREMRGIWVASVANIDWPSAPGLSDETLKAEADAIISRSEAMGMNTIFLQVRPCSDALYRSDIEPLSSYLVGSDFASPLRTDWLQYWIDATHAKGMELHAWINPFRVTPKADYNCADSHLSKTHPEWLVKYANKLYLNPGLPDARDYVTRVVMDIVRRYDVDGIHFDDYFYPYPSKGEVFDDSKSFAAYNPRHLKIDNWRRANVTAVISTVADSIRAAKPWVQFGISPFGVWRNKRDDNTGSDTRAGVTDYDVLYADILKWIDEDYIDYVVPQIYWEAGNKWCDFDVLEKWWGDRATDKTKVFVGHAVFKINDGKVPNQGWNSKAEMPSQMQKVRQNERLGGSVFFSYRQFNRNILGFEDYLSSDFYKHKALQSPMRNGKAGAIEIKHLERDGRLLTWEAEGDTSMVRFFMVFRAPRGESDGLGGNETIYSIVDHPYVYIPASRGRRQRYAYRVAAVDKFRVIHELSRRITVRE